MVAEYRYISRPSDRQVLQLILGLTLNCELNSSGLTFQRTGSHMGRRFDLEVPLFTSLKLRKSWRGFARMSNIDKATVPFST